MSTKKKKETFELNPPGIGVPLVKTPGSIVMSKVKQTRRLMIGIPVTGNVRIEWVQARYGQVIPCNWSHIEFIQYIDQYSPLGFLVADARNVCVEHFIREGFEWLFFIDHDTVLPPYTTVLYNERIQKADVPIWGGLYFTKSTPSEPLIYRGIGNSYFSDWKMGDEVWVDGMGLGCHVIHRSILQTLWDESPEYMVGPFKTRRVFETPTNVYHDPETNLWSSAGGTEDLTFYQRIIQNDILEKAGWPKIAKKKWPFLCDTRIYCKHITPDGIQYPANGEDAKFMQPKEKKKK